MPGSRSIEKGEQAAWLWLQQKALAMPPAAAFKPAAAPAGANTPCAVVTLPTGDHPLYWEGYQITAEQESQLLADSVLRFMDECAQEAASKSTA